MPFPSYSAILFLGLVACRAGAPSAAPAPKATDLEALVDRYWSALARGDTATALALQLDQSAVLETPNLGVLRVEVFWDRGHYTKGVFVDSAAPDTAYLRLNLAPGTASPLCFSTEQRLPLLVTFVRRGRAWRIATVREDIDCM